MVYVAEIMKIKNLEIQIDCKLILHNVNNNVNQHVEEDRVSA